MRVTIRRPLSALRAEAAPYGRCGQLAMMSSATYPAIAPGGPAVLEKRAYAFLREVGGRQLTISDDLEAAALSGRREVEERALRAGLDLLLYARSESAAARAHRRILLAVRAGRLSPGTIVRGAERVRALVSRRA